MSESRTDFVPLAPVHLVKPNGSVRAFGLGAATAAARGAAIHLAVAASTDGAQILLGPGTFATAAAIDLSKGGTINVDLAGAGRGVTTIQSSAILTTHGPAIHPGAMCRVSDLTIDCVLTGQYQAGFGVISDLSQPVSTTAHLDRVDIIADTDGLYFKQTGASSLICWDCTFATQWDVIYSAGVGPYTWDFHNCRFSSLGLSSVLASWKTALIRVSGSTYRYYKCSFKCDNPTVDEASSGIADGSGTVELHDCDFTVTAAEGVDPFDIVNTFGATVKIFGGSGSGTAGAYLTQGSVSYSAAGSLLAAIKTIDGSGSGLDADKLRNTTPTAAGLALIDDADASAQRTTLGLGTAATLTSDTDTTLAANSDTRLATQKAIKAYVDTAVTGLLDLKGATDASSNPNYPSALKGDVYVVTVAGKVGGASGKSVDAGDVYLATADNAGGTEASVGTSWVVVEHNGTFQPLDSELTALAGLTSAADSLPYFTGAGTAAIATLTTFARSLLDDAAASNARTTLGLGNIATQAANNVTITGGALSNVTVDDGTFSGDGSGLSSINAITIQGVSPTASFLALADDTTNAALRFTLGLQKKSVTFMVFPPGVPWSTGDGKFLWRVPPSWNGAVIDYVNAQAGTAGTTGDSTVQIARVRSGTPADVLGSDPLDINTGETNSDTGDPGTIDTANDDMATGDFLRIDIDAVSTIPPQGLQVTVEATL